LLLLSCRSNRLDESIVDNNHLQSLLVFLTEQSTCTSFRAHLSEFIRYLRHFAQLGILYQPPILYILMELHKAKDLCRITLHQLIDVLERFHTINYVDVYHHLNIMNFDRFLQQMIADSE
jgi:hypothetical protein